MSRADTFLASTVGRKVIMAVTGFILFAFVCVHMIGNLQIYLPQAADGHWAINAYAHFLKTFVHGWFIWVFRAVIATCVVLHVWAAITLVLENWRARPQGYRKNLWRRSDFATRQIFWGGLAILFFLAYHLLHLTLGSVLPGFDAEDVRRNFIAGFTIVPASIAYIIAMVVLGLHLYHGIWSMLQTLGMSHPRYDPLRKAFATIFAILIAAGNISFPLMVMAKVIK